MSVWEWLSDNGQDMLCYASMDALEFGNLNWRHWSQLFYGKCDPIFAGKKDIGMRIIIYRDYLVIFRGEDGEGSGTAVPELCALFSNWNGHSWSSLKTSSFQSKSRTQKPDWRMNLIPATDRCLDFIISAKAKVECKWTRYWEIGTERIKKWPQILQTPQTVSEWV
jgi:hypothetical protein